mgnify:CR=1 FL=1
MAKVGYIITENTRHLFSTAQVRAYVDEVAHILGQDPDEAVLDEDMDEDLDAEDVLTDPDLGFTNQWRSETSERVPPCSLIAETKRETSRR